MAASDKAIVLSLILVVGLVRPLQTIAYILFGAGGILAVCGLFKNTALRLLLSFLVIVAIIYLNFQPQISDLMRR